MSRIVEDYLERVAARLGHLSEAEREATVAEMRVGLDEEMRKIREREPARSADEIALAAVHAFGEPEEVAPERALEEPRRVSWRAWFAETRVKWTLLAFALVALFLILATVGSMKLFDSQEGTSLQSGPNLLYRVSDYSRENGTANDTFVLDERVARAELHVATTRKEGGGCVAVRIVNPAGAIVLDEASGCGDVARAIELAESGRWRVEYVFRDFSGTIVVSVPSWRHA